MTNLPTYLQGRIEKEADEYARTYNGTKTIKRPYLAGASFLYSLLKEEKGEVGRWRKEGYEQLYKRAKAGYRIACYIDYDFYRDGGSHPMCRDICTIGQNPTHLEFSSRGHGYSGYIEPDENELKNFVEECERLNIEWLDTETPVVAGCGELVAMLQKIRNRTSGYSAKCMVYLRDYIDKEIELLNKKNNNENVD
jgi:hypothetical protein